MRYSQPVDYLPSSWQDRGLYVPFLAARLSRARLRLGNKGQAELILPNLSGGRGYSVVDWKTLKSVVTTGIYDRYLMDVVATESVDTPIAMYWSALRAASSGFAGPVVARIAREEIAENTKFQLLTTFTFVRNIVAHFDPYGFTKYNGMWHTQEAQHYVRTIMRDASSALKIRYDELYLRIEVVATIVSPIGLPSSTVMGRLRRLMKDMLAGGEAARKWTQGSTSDATESAIIVSDSIAHICEHGAALISKIDTLLVDIVSLIGDWDTHCDDLVGTIQELAWLFDGWDATIKLFSQIETCLQDDGKATFTKILSMMPILPRSMMSGPIQDTESKVPLRSKRVLPHSDWRTGILDIEYIRRLEAINNK